MKPAVMNLSKWTEKTAGAVRRICQQKQAPCVGFSLLFFDPTAVPEQQWNFVIELAYDPRNPPGEEERKQVQQAFEFITEGIKRIMGGEIVESDPVEQTREARWH